MRSDFPESKEERTAWGSFLLHYNPNTIIITDLLGKIIFVNAVFTSLTGFKPEDVLDQNIEALDLHDLSSATGFSWDAIKDGDVWEGEIVSQKKNKETFQEQLFVLPVTDQSNSVCQIAFIKRDISERKKVEQELYAMTEALEERIREQRATKMELAYLNSQHELILDSAAEGIFGVDVEGSITFMNRAAEKMTGYKRDELIGKPHHDFFRDPEIINRPLFTSLCPVFSSLKAGKTLRGFEEIFRRRDGSFFPVKLVSSPILEDRTVIGSVVTFNDQLWYCELPLPPPAE